MTSASTLSEDDISVKFITPGLTSSGLGRGHPDSSPSELHQPVSDDLAISELREHWGAARKADFDAPSLRKWLDWMRKNQLTPKGREPSTRHQAELI